VDGKGATVKNLDSDPRLQKLARELTDLDKVAPPSGPGPDDKVVRHHLARADLLEKVIAVEKVDGRDPWIRQLADSLSTAAQASPAADNRASERLAILVKQVVPALPPGSSLAGYVTYREMQADYSAKLGKGKPDINNVQQEWVDHLAKFVQTYPKADDTPDALLQLGMVNEFLGKEVEAKNWYSRAVKDFAGTPQATKAAGAVRRLDLEGQPLQLAGPLLNDPATTQNVEQLRGKVVVVYYWASWNNQCTGDFARLKQMLDTYGSKGLVLLCVNLDSSVEEARKYLTSTPAPGVHLYQEGGLEGKLATDYGITVLPNLFLVGKDGKVASKNVQINTLEDEVKKLLK